jgi:hypothetical protein
MMDEPRLEELLHRIETLEREKRRWKSIGIGSLSVLVALVLFGGLFSVATAVVIRAQYVEVLRAEQEAAMRALDAAEQARQAALEAEHRAKQAAEGRAKKDDR